MTAPEISVVVPAFESADLVSECLASLHRQRGVRAEIIVSDDSRTDVLRTLCLGPGVQRLEGARTGNPVDNWNHGLAHASAELRVLVHQDEVLLDPLYLRRAVDAFGDPAVSAVIGRAVVRGSERPSRFNRLSALARRLPGRAALLPGLNWIGPTAAFVFRSPARFNASLVQMVDVDFYIRRLREGRSVVLEGPCVGSRGYHAAQITASIDAVATALAEIDRLPIGPLSKSVAKLAHRARRWTR